MSAVQLLVLAILFEVGATLCLKASDGFSRAGFSALVVVGYVCSFAALGLALKNGLDLSTGYAIWSAAGTSLIAVLGVWVFRESLSPTAVLGVVLIVVGVVLVHVGSPAD